MTKTYVFTIKGVGKGETLQEAWEACKDALHIDDLEADEVEHELIEEDEEE